MKRVVFQALLAKSAHRILLTAQGRLPILRDLSNLPHVFQEFHLGQYCQREEARPPVREAPRPQRRAALDDPHLHQEGGQGHRRQRSEEHTSELQSLMRISYAVFCLKTKNQTRLKNKTHTTKRTHSQLQ